MAKWHLNTSFLFTAMTIFAMSLSGYADSGPAVLKTVRPITTGPLKADLRSGLEKIKKSTGSSEGQLILVGPKASEKFKGLSPQGPRTGGGGNSCALVIQENSKQLVSMLGLMPGLLSKSQEIKLQEKIDSATFFVKNALVKDGQSKDAINYPEENKIELSPRLCNSELIEVSGRAMALLFHEYLGLMKLDDKDYKISGSFLTNYAALIQHVPVLTNSALNQKLYRAVISKFLREANQPQSPLAKIIARENRTDGRNPEGTIASKITQRDLQVVVSEELQQGALWNNAVAQKNQCVTTGDEASYWIYLSTKAHIHSGNQFATLKFRVQAQEILSVSISKPTQTLSCQDYPEDGTAFGSVKSKVVVSEIQLVPASAADL